MRNKRSTATDDDLEFQMTNMLYRVVLLADDLSDERVRAARQNEVMLLAEEGLELVERLGDRLIVT